MSKILSLAKLVEQLTCPEVMNPYRLLLSNKFTILPRKMYHLCLYDSFGSPIGQPWSLEGGRLSVPSAVVADKSKYHLCGSRRSP